MLEFNISFVYDVINLIVLCLLLKKFLIKPVTDIMEKRKEMIEQGLTNARTSEREAGELKVQYEEALKNARNESCRIIDDAKIRADEERDRILAETDSQVSELMKRAEKNIEMEKEKAMLSLKTRIAEVALSASRKVTAELNRSEDDLSLYDQFLEKAGDSYDTGSK